MTERLYLHIGAPKTGTTYVQHALHRNRKKLKSAGVLYPRVAGNAHHTSVWDLRAMWEQREFATDIRGHWDKAVQAVREWDGTTAVMSSELFVYADPEECTRALTAFGDVDVHVIYTARDLVRQAPAVWQERIKNQYTLEYGEFLTDLVGKSRTPMAKGFWKAQDASTALRRWSQGVPPEHVHVVTTPPAGSPPILLWERFIGVLGLAGGDYDADVPAVNTSLSATAAEVLRRYNIRHGDALTPLQYRRRVVTSGLLDVLATEVADSSKLTLSPVHESALVARGKAVGDDIAQCGYDVVGSLDDLAPDASSRQLLAGRPSGRHPGDVTDVEVSEALLDTIDNLLREKGAGRRQRKPKKKQPGSA
jgi:hypothetical protein